MREREQIKAPISERLRREFPTDTVDVSDGYQNNIHVIVVSRRFDAMAEREKQEFLWSLIDDAGLDDAEEQLISLIVPASPSEVRP